MRLAGTVRCYDGSVGFLLRVLINTLALYLASLLIPGIELMVGGFTVAGFWSAVFGAIVVGLVSWLLTAFLSDRGRVEVIVYRD